MVVIGFFGTVISGFYIFKEIKASIFYLLIKLLVAAVILSGCSFLINYFSIHILFKLILLSGVYIIILILVKLINKADIFRLKEALQLS